MPAGQHGAELRRAELSAADDRHRDHVRKPGDRDPAGGAAAGRTGRADAVRRHPAGFLGVLIVVSPWDAELHWAIFLSLGSCICTSVYFILSRMLAREATATQQIWASGIATLFLAPLAFWQWQEPSGPLVVLMMCLIGLFGASSHSLVTLAHRMADASVLAPVVYLQLLFATIGGYLVFHQVPGASTLLGAMVIIAGGVLLWLSGRRKRIAAIRTSAIAISSEQSERKLKEDR
ncbi:hypothetical protein DPM13_08325 [Paracoccus mutanolyticus]|uniref:EamA domain-containing protein n=1 Tax=Paracoccus mutanolyticus TaxID=1499308 RepID=A0ABM6WRC7_9RHOB|nr:hypothetical protein DPM13_08325 [Paracoccus mutanolyticus]